MAIRYEDLYKTYESRMDEARADSPHDYHIIEFEKMCKDMIASALAEHDQ